MPILAVLSLSDSLRSVWSRLADDSALDLALAGDPTEFMRLGAAVRLMVAAGEEGRMEALLRELATPSPPEIAAVGTATDHRTAATLLRAGAVEYFALPSDYDLLLSWVRERVARIESQVQGRGFAEAQHSRYDFKEILGTSAALRSALDRAARIIPHADVTVLLTGETGTGKELMARAIHYNGPRRAAPFVDINCAAIPEQLLESELFGHEKGAFTGAGAAKPGLFEVAHHGTLFLDEIAQLALPLQGKLLRALEERQIRRVGGTRTITVDVRVIAATHVNLARAVRTGAFREDLYYRLNVVPIELPPLRERRADVPMLAARFLGVFAERHRLPVPTLSLSASAALAEYDWPGNVRELRNAMERALLLATHPELRAEDIVLRSPAPEPVSPTALPFPATAHTLLTTAAARMLELTNGNRSEAARRLGVSRAKLLRLLSALPDAEAARMTDSISDDPQEDPA